MPENIVFPKLHSTRTSTDWSASVLFHVNVVDSMNVMEESAAVPMNRIVFFAFLPNESDTVMLILFLLTYLRFFVLYPAVKVNDFVSASYVTS